MTVGYWIGEAAAWPFNGLGSLTKAVGAGLRREAANGTAGLVGEDAAITAFTTPLFLAAAAVLFIATEVALAILGWAALYHQTTASWLSTNTAVLAAFAGVAAAVFWGLVALDVRQGRIAGPWAELPSSLRHRYELIAWAFALASLVALAAFYGWRELQIESAASGDHEAMRRWLGVVIIVTYGAIIGAGALFSGWALLRSIEIVGVTLMAVPGWALGAAEGACRWSINGIDGLHGFGTSVYDCPAGLGKGVWDWACSFEKIGRGLHLAPVVFEERPRIVPKF